MSSAAKVGPEIERLLACFDSGPVAVVCLAPDGRLLAASPSFAGMIGQPERAVAGRPLIELIHPDDRPGYAEAIGNVFAAGHHPSLERRGRLSTADGRPLWIQTHLSLVADDDSNGEYAVVLIQDMTEWRGIEVQNAHLFGFPLALVFVAGFDGYFIRVGAGYERLLGWTERELLTRAPSGSSFTPTRLRCLGRRSRRPLRETSR